MSEPSIPDILLFSYSVVEYSYSFAKVSTYFSLHLRICLDTMFIFFRLSFVIRPEMAPVASGRRCQWVM